MSPQTQSITIPSKSLEISTYQFLFYLFRNVQSSYLDIGVRVYNILFLSILMEFYYIYSFATFFTEYIRMFLPVTYTLFFLMGA